MFIDKSGCGDLKRVSLILRMEGLIFVFGFVFGGHFSAPLSSHADAKVAFIWDPIRQSSFNIFGLLFLLGAGVFLCNPEKRS